jgi:acyl-[acyl carrier protein]--UDP-N-acetylglucosamine O-acyltransferase
MEVDELLGWAGVVNNHWKQTILAAGSVVTKDVAPYTIVAGVPKIIKIISDKLFER